MSEREQVLAQLENACSNLLAVSVLGEKPRIAAWGLVKAGKSSLLNMLSGHVEQEFFKTGAVRTTRVNRELETDHYILVDTPGLGIDDDDSEQAFKGLDSADIILFVHALQGELDQEEIDLLIEVKAVYTEEIDRRLVIVLSQLDKDENGAMNSVSSRIMEQLQEQIGIQPTCFKVSNTRYRKGIAESKPVLTKKSGIPNLAQYLDTLSLEIKDQLEAARYRRQQVREAQLLKELEQAIEEERQFISSLKKPYIEKISIFNQIMEKLRQEFNSHSDEISIIQKKINSI
ncbi:GTPase [Halomonas sp. Bachu 37]|uniref:GTPase n=1 Tax=Halomonas kashgarensis TaxID=3084920 RepID=UPI003217CAD0